MRGTTVAALTLTLLAAGCATTSSDPRSRRIDPIEGWNRGVFSFNEAIDKNLLKPVATVYHDAVPELVRQGVTNAFNNFEDVWSSANNFLQGKGQYGFETGMRVAMNTVFGFGGILDISTSMGLERHTEDFGQTLGRWGFAPGPYIVWPLLGPSTLRDSVGLPLDLYAGSPGWAIHDTGWQWGVGTLHLINSRSNLLSAGDLLNDISLDKYTFVRDAYLQRRRSLVNDGEDPSGGSKQDDDNDSGYAPMSTTPAAPPAAASAPAK
jgi:phospholipid-binding lipoprotein MlaA